MPEQPEKVALLNARARELTRPLAGESHAGNESEYLRFNLNNGKLFGVLKNTLNEIVYPRHMTSIPGTPVFIAGVVYWRDKILSVLDINYLCTGLAHQEINDLSRIIVVGDNEKSIGLLAAGVDDYYPFDTSELTALSVISGPLSLDCFLGVLPCSTLLLNINTLMADLTLIVNQ